MAEPAIPHRAPMRFLTALRAEEDGVAVGEALVGADSPAAEAGAVRPAYLIELIAQAAAAHAALGAGGGLPIAGRLVGVSGWRWLRPAPAGHPLSLRLRPGPTLGGLRAYEGEVAVDGHACAAGSIQVALA